MNGKSHWRVSEPPGYDVASTVNSGAILLTTFPVLARVSKSWIEMKILFQYLKKMFFYKGYNLNKLIAWLQCYEWYSYNTAKYGKSEGEVIYVNCRVSLEICYFMYSAVLSNDSSLCVLSTDKK